MIQKCFEMRKPRKFDGRSHVLCALVALVALGGCGPGSPPAPLVASSGQVRLAVASAMSMYAASRATDQVSFGATPALVADIRRAGLATWLDSQMALPVSAILTPNPYINYDLNDLNIINDDRVYLVDSLTWLHFSENPPPFTIPIIAKFRKFFIGSLATGRCLQPAVLPLYYAASLKLVIRPSTSGVLEYRIAGIRVCRLSSWMTLVGVLPLIPWCGRRPLKYS